MTLSDSNPLKQQRPEQQFLEHPTLSSHFLLSVQRMDPTSWSRLVTTFGPIVYRWCEGLGSCRAAQRLRS